MNAAKTRSLLAAPVALLTVCTGWAQTPGGVHGVGHAHTPLKAVFTVVFQSLVTGNLAAGLAGAAVLAVWRLVRYLMPHPAGGRTRWRPYYPNRPARRSFMAF
jgi:hypothetical protein